MTKSVALYARVSTAQHQEKGLDSQVQALSRFCEENNYSDILVYKDFGVSGAKEHRKELSRLLKDCEDGLVSTVVVYSFSRFARSVSHLVKALDFFTSREIAFVSLSEKLDARTSHGRFTLQILGSVAELERNMIRDRVVNGLVAARARGKVLGAPKTINEELILELIKKGGYSYSEIARLGKCSKTSVFRVVKKYKASLHKSEVEVCEV